MNKPTNEWTCNVKFPGDSLPDKKLKTNLDPEGQYRAEQNRKKT
jgi:hypothetical protein